MGWVTAKNFTDTSGYHNATQELNEYMTENRRDVALKALQYIKGYHDTDDRFTRRCDVVLQYIDRLEKMVSEHWAARMSNGEKLADMPNLENINDIFASRMSDERLDDEKSSDKPDETPSESDVSLVDLNVQTESGEIVTIGVAPKDLVDPKQAKKPGRPKRL